MDYDVQLYCHLRKFRSEAEMTQEQLATLLGVTRQTVAAIEKSRYNPSLILAYKIAKVFGAKIEDIFEFEDKGEE